MSSVGAVALEAQGHLFRVRCLGSERIGGGKRGKVVGFSRGSRKRLLEKMARLDVSKARPLFVSLTYPAEFPDCGVARRHLRALLKRLGRRFPRLSVVWRLELQRRGAPHFHLLVWGVKFLSVGLLRALWAGVIGYVGSARLQLDVSKLRSWRGLLSYVAKYMGKVQAAYEVADMGSGGGQLDYSTYLAGLFGRVWGVFRADHLPWGRLDQVAGDWGPWFWRVKRLARHAWARIGVGSAGFTLFRENPYRWYEVSSGFWSGGSGLTPRCQG